MAQEKTQSLRMNALGRLGDERHGGMNALERELEAAVAQTQAVLRLLQQPK